MVRVPISITVSVRVRVAIPIHGVVKVRIRLRARVRVWVRVKDGVRVRISLVDCIVAACTHKGHCHREPREKPVFSCVAHVHVDYRTSD